MRRKIKMTPGDTGERRRKTDRPLTARGAFIRTLVGLQALTALCAIAALIWMGFVFSHKLDKATERADVNNARISAIQDSRRDQCRDSNNRHQRTIKALNVLGAQQATQVSAQIAAEQHAFPGNPVVALLIGIQRAEVAGGTRSIVPLVDALAPLRECRLGAK